MNLFFSKYLTILIIIGLVSCLALAESRSNSEMMPNLHKAPASETEVSIYDKYIQANAPSNEAFVAVQRIASKYIEQKQWEQAAEIFEKYRIYFTSDDKKFQNIIDLILGKSDSLIVTNLGPGINTEGDELKPMPTIDGKKMYFTGSKRADNSGIDDIFISEYENGAWQKASNYGSLLNTGKSESITGISTDGTRILLFGNYPKSLGRGDIFKINKTQIGWSQIEHLPAPINSEYFECDATYSADGKAILFVSDRPGGVGAYQKKDLPYNGDVWGNTDIYVTIQTENGWSDPINLGNIINTPFAERTPYLHPDGKTLYFSSDGHYGLGFLDVFVSVRLKEDSWTEWSEPVNLGKMINTAGDDWGYIFATKGDIAYFTTDKLPEGRGGFDIYSITIPEVARPERVATINGQVTDENGKPLEATINWEDISQREKKSLGELFSDPVDGAYFIVLPLGKNYEYYAYKKGYFPTTNSIDLRNQAQNRSIERTENIILESIVGLAESGVKKYILNIFNTGQYNFNPAAYSSINMLVDLLKENSNIKVEVYAHTDSRGTDEFNDQLSELRAQTMRNHLLKNGISDDRIIAIGYGKRQPIVPNDSPENMSINRRLEFRFHNK